MAVNSRTGRGIGEEPEAVYPVAEGLLVNPMVLNLCMLDPRIVAMIQKLILHKAQICAYTSGHIELHFHDASVKATLKAIL